MTELPVSLLLSGMAVFGYTQEAAPLGIIVATGVHGHMGFGIWQSIHAALMFLSLVGISRHALYLMWFMQQYW